MICPLFFFLSICFPSSVEIRNKCFLSYPPAPFSFRPVVPGRFAFPSPILCDRMSLCCVWSTYLQWVSSLTMIVCCGYMLELINFFFFFFFVLMQRISCPPFFSLSLFFVREVGGSKHGRTTDIWVSCYNRFFFGVLVACFLLGKKEKSLEGFSLRNFFSLLISRTLFCMQFS